MTTLIQLNVRESAMIVASLRHMLQMIMADDNWSDDIATDGGTIAPISCDEIDALCERINFSDGGTITVYSVSGDDDNGTWTELFTKSKKAEKRYRKLTKKADYLDTYNHNSHRLKLENLSVTPQVPAELQETINEILNSDELMVSSDVGDLLADWEA